MTDVALVLDPYRKLKYFEKAGWAPAWVEAARGIVRDEYDRTYAGRKVDDDVIEVSKVWLM